MAQVPDSAVQQALAELKELRASVEPIRAEDIERIQAVFNETDPSTLAEVSLPTLDRTVERLTELHDQLAQA